MDDFGMENFWKRRRVCFGLAAVLAMGCILRTFRLGVSPPGLWFDEALNGLDAWKVWQPGGGFRLIYPDVFPREPMFETLLALAVHWGGAKIVVMRSVSAAVGTIELLLLYMMLRKEAGEGVALTAAGVLAGMRWHVLFSRLIFRTLVLPGWITGLVWAALAYRRRPTAWRAALVGILIGGGFYIYLAWYFMAPFVIGIVLWISSDRRGPGRLHLGLILIVAGAVFAPLGMHYLAHPGDLFSRAQAVSIFQEGVGAGLREIAKNAFEAALMFHWRGDHVPTQNFPHAAALDPIQGIFFLWGIALAARGIKRGEALPALLIGWIACGTAATVFTQTDSPNFLRTLVVTPAAAALSAIGLVDAGGRWFKREASSAIALVLGASAMWTIYDLQRWTYRPDVTGKFQLETIAMADAAKETANPQTAVFIPGLMFGSLPFQFEAIGAKGIYPYDDWSFLAPWPPTPETQGQPEPARRIVFLTSEGAIATTMRSVVRGKSSILMLTERTAPLTIIPSVVIDESGLPASDVVQRMNRDAAGR